MHRKSTQLLRGFSGKASLAKAHNLLSDTAACCFGSIIHGMGVTRHVMAQACEQVPKAVLQATIADGAPTARTVPKVAPAAL